MTSIVTAKPHTKRQHVWFVNQLKFSCHAVKLQGEEMGRMV